MKTKKVLRFYCDFCKKAGFSKGRMRTHESKCFRNPARVCTLCEEADEGPQKPSAELASLLSFDKEDYGMADLRAASNNCPACIMAAIFQRKLQSTEDFKEEGPLNYGFEYKAEMDKWYERQRPGGIEI